SALPLLDRRCGRRRRPVRGRLGCGSCRSVCRDHPFLGGAAGGTPSARPARRYLSPICRRGPALPPSHFTVEGRRPARGATADCGYDLHSRMLFPCCRSHCRVVGVPSTARLHPHLSEIALIATAMGGAL